MKFRSVVVISAALLLTSLPALAAADVIPYGALGTTYTDNATGSHANPVSEQVIDAVVGLEVRHESSRASIDGDVNFGRREFTRTQLSGENISSGFIRGDLTLIPERLTWQFEDGYGQANSRTFVALSEIDNEDVNYYSTGPDGRFNFADRYTTWFSARVAGTQFSESDIDSRRFNGEIGVARYLTSNAQLGAAYARRQIDYTNNDLYVGGYTDVGFLSYTVNSQRTFFVVELGGESLTLDDGTEGNEPHAVMGFQRAVSPRVTLNLEYQHGFSDVGSGLRADLTDRFQQGSSSNIRVTAQPYVVDSAYLMAVRSGGRLLTAWQVSWIKEDYGATSAFSRETYGADLRGYYQLNTKWALECRARWLSETTTTTDERSQYLNFAIGISRHLSRSLQIALAAERSGGRASIDSEDISETRATLLLSYSPPARGQPMFEAPTQLRLYERSRGLVNQTQQSTITTGTTTGR